MPEMWLSLHSRSIISHLKLTHLKAICKCSSICGKYWEGREIPFPFITGGHFTGAPHTPNRTGPHAPHSFQVPCSINPDINGNEAGEEAGAGLKWPVTREPFRAESQAPGSQAPPSGVGRLGSSGWRAVSQLASFPQEPGRANLYLISRDSPGSSFSALQLLFLV